MATFKFRNAEIEIHPSEYYAQKRVRTGKTAKDKKNGHVPYRKNRRVWDRNSGQWVKA